MSSSTAVDKKEDSDELEVKFVPIPETLSESFQNIFTNYKDGLVKSVPGGLVMGPRYAASADKIYGIKPREDDIWLLTFPKAGTTWVSEMLWLIANNCDFETALKTPLMQRVFFPEIAYLGAPRSIIDGNNSVNSLPPMTLSMKITQAPSPRIIRPHLPFYLLHPTLQETSKMVYVARNPKDVIVSYYFHHKLIKLHEYKGSIEEFAQYFMDDKVMYTPFFPHVLEAWKRRHLPNMHFIFYEDLKTDLRGEIKKMADFLGKELSEEQLDRLKEHLKFESIEKNDAVNNESGRKAGVFNDGFKFIRKGKVGDWKNHFSEEMNEKIDKWIEKNLEGTDLKFVTELEVQD